MRSGRRGDLRSAIEREHIEIVAEPGERSGRRSSTIKLTITVKTPNGSLSQRRTVTLSSTGRGSRFIVTDGVTDNQGSVIATMSSTIANRRRSPRPSPA